MATAAGDVPHEQQGLGADHAVEARVGDLRGVGEVAHDRRQGIALIDVEDVDALDAVRPERPRVAVLADLEHAAADVVRVQGEETVDVVAVYRRPALEPEAGADGLGARQVAEVDRAHARCRARAAQGAAGGLAGDGPARVRRRAAGLAAGGERAEQRARDVPRKTARGVERGVQAR